jgi:hypothetical protein
VTTLDIGASRGWVEAKGSRTVRHVLNRHNDRPGRLSCWPRGWLGPTQALDQGSVTVPPTVAA